MSIQIIAEIGTSHAGSLSKAFELIDAAQESGADTVKFQWIYADEILHPNTGYVKLPTGTIPLYERFKELEVSPSFFAAVKEYSEKHTMNFLCTPFGLRSAQQLLDLQPKEIKIASPELNHFPLLHFLNQTCTEMTKEPALILSSGVSLLSDIEKALYATRSIKKRILLHCVTAYPAPEEEYNLKVLSLLKELFNIPIGVSDHSLDPLLVPVLAIAGGATVIEKHITLSKSTAGLDDPVALDPKEFKHMVKAVRHAELCNPSEICREMENTYGSSRVSRVWGSGKKELAPSEYMNYGRTNRSIHFVKNLPAYAVIKEGDIQVLRTEKELSLGISPEFFDLALGAVLSKSAQSGEGLTWKHITAH